MNDPLRTLAGYNAWANRDLLDTLAQVDPVLHATEVDAAIRLVNHYHIVGRIFAAHLAGRAHGYTATNTDGTPALAALRTDLLACDRWFVDYAGTLTPDVAAERIAFTFTDGDRGLMSRAEMVTHVTLHGGYHRGEVGQILKRLNIPLPWDTYAVFLHQTEPSRRRQESTPAPVS
ncbi:DinB family protein [Dongia sp.]|uniref:DinB family protein n=1 Tax=Dongia sp. TaxID=1977262 RepID=UPI0035B19084